MPHNKRKEEGPLSYEDYLYEQFGKPTVFIGAPSPRNPTPTTPDGTEAGSRRATAAQPWWQRMLNNFGSGFHAQLRPAEPRVGFINPRPLAAAYPEGSFYRQQATEMGGTPARLPTLPTLTSSATPSGPSSAQAVSPTSEPDPIAEIMKRKADLEERQVRVQEQRNEYDMRANEADVAARRYVAEGNWREASAQRQLQRELALASNDLALQQLALDRQQYALQAQTDTVKMIHSIISDPVTLAAFQRLGLSLPGMPSFEDTPNPVAASPASYNTPRGYNAPPPPATNPLARTSEAVLNSIMDSPKASEENKARAEMELARRASPYTGNTEADFASLMQGGPDLRSTAQEQAALLAGPSDEQILSSNTQWIPGKGWGPTLSPGMPLRANDPTQVVQPGPTGWQIVSVEPKAAPKPKSTSTDSLVEQFNAALSKAKATARPQAPISPQARAVMNNEQLNAFIIEAALAGQNPADLLKLGERSAPRQGTSVARR